MADRLPARESNDRGNAEKRQRPIWARIALTLAVLSAIAVPALFLADYLRGSRTFPANPDGASRVHNYAASQYVAYSYLFGRKIAERRVGHIVGQQPMVSGYRLEAHASNLVFEFRPGAWAAPENHWLTYTLSPVFTLSFFLFMVFPLPLSGVMLLCSCEQERQRLRISAVLALAVAPSVVVLFIRFGLSERLFIALCAGGLMSAAIGALSMIRAKRRLMACLPVIFHAGTVILLWATPP